MFVLLVAMELETMYSQRGNKLLVYDGYKFTLEKVKVGYKTSWRCTSRNCKTRMFTNVDGNRLLEVVGEHNHGRSEKLKLEKIANELKLKAVTELAGEKKKIMEAVREVAEVGVNKTELGLIKRSIQKALKSAALVPNATRRYCLVIIRRGGI